MRIISGKYKGKKLEGFNIIGTRPTMDRVKESLFGMIQNYINGSIVLDLFAGSGALGLEAISNGAKKCYFIDNNIEAIKTIKNNSINVQEDLEIINTDYKKFLKNTNEKFDIIFLDPPYEANNLNKALRIIEERDIRIRYITLIWSLSILTVIAIALSVVQTRRRQLQKKDAELNEYRNRVTTMQEYSRILEKIKDSVPEKDELIESQINILNRLMNILVHSQEEIKLTFYNEFLNLTHKSEEGSSAMKAVFLHSFEVQYPEVRRTLKYNYPALTDKDIDLYSLIGLGCSTSVIAYLYTTSESYIYNCRMSLRKKLNLSDDRNAFAVHLSELTSKQ